MLPDAYPKSEDRVAGEALSGKDVLTWLGPKARFPERIHSKYNLSLDFVQVFLAFKHSTPCKLIVMDGQASLELSKRLAE